MLRKIAGSLLRTAGLQRIQPPPPQPLPQLETFLAILARKGFAPKNVLDVGANHGYWTRRAMVYFPTAHYTLIEPQEDLRQYVADLESKITWISAGVSDAPGMLPFTIAARDDSSSFVPGATTGPQIEVPVLTINEIAGRIGAIPEMVKIDTEGFDLKALAGASGLCGKTEVFFVEGSVLCPEFENSALAVLRKMDTLGYRLVDITDINRTMKNNVLWLCEFAFVRKGSSLFSNETYS